jgi:predicted aldo/keto reductase-like oxidoreductase
MKRTFSRRDFSRIVAGTPLAGSAAAAAGGLPTRALGKTGFQASILGLGAQRIADRPMEQSEVDRLIGEALDNGLNYIDTARGYGESEEKLGRALKGKRDKVFLVTKTRAATRDAAFKEIEQSLRLLQTDHVDCVHAHNISRDDRFPDLDHALSRDGVLGAILEAKKRGMTKHVGCTSHLWPARVLPVFATGEIELFMCSLNFVEKHIYGYEEKVLPEAQRRGIGVIAMKVLGGPRQGTPVPLLSSKQDYEATLRYVWSVPGVSVAIIGMRNVDELRQALAAARSHRPFSKTELAAVTERGKALAAEWGPLRGKVA